MADTTGRDYSGHGEETPGAPADRRCLACNASLEGYRTGAIWCSDACRKRHKRRHDRKKTLRESYESGHPDVSLDALYDSANFSLAENAEDAEGEAQDSGHDVDEYLYGRSGLFADAYASQAAVDEIHRRYDDLLEPLLGRQRRNPGVRLPEIDRLIRARDADLERVRAYDRASDRLRAYSGYTRTRAMERQREHDAMSAFSRELPGGSRRAPQGYTGRSTQDLIAWLQALSSDCASGLRSGNGHRRAPVTGRTVTDHRSGHLSRPMWDIYPSIVGYLTSG
jgi:hypothetical protein